MSDEYKISWANLQFIEKSLSNLSSSIDYVDSRVNQVDNNTLVISKNVAKNGMKTFYKVGFILNGKILNITHIISKITKFKMNKDCNLVVGISGTCPDYTLANSIYRALVDKTSTQQFNYDVF